MEHTTPFGKAQLVNQAGRVSNHNQMHAFLANHGARAWYSIPGLTAHVYDYLVVFLARLLSIMGTSLPANLLAEVGVKHLPRNDTGWTTQQSPVTLTL